MHTFEQSKWPNEDGFAVRWNNKNGSGQARMPDPIYPETMTLAIFRTERAAQEWAGEQWCAHITTSAVWFTVHDYVSM